MQHEANFSHTAIISHSLFLIPYSSFLIPSPPHSTIIIPHSAYLIRFIGYIIVVLRYDLLQAYHFILALPATRMEYSCAVLGINGYLTTWFQCRFCFASIRYRSGLIHWHYPCLPEFFPILPMAKPSASPFNMENTVKSAHFNRTLLHWHHYKNLLYTSLVHARFRNQFYGFCTPEYYKHFNGWGKTYVDLAIGIPWLPLCTARNEPAERKCLLTSCH